MTCTNFVAVQTNPKLYLNLLELEYSGDVAQNEAEVLACFDRALNSAMPIESRLLFCQRKVEFLEDFGSNINVYGFSFLLLKSNTGAHGVVSLVGLTFFA